ncbi:UV DNA damage repair endonuclease UvsE [Brevibacillus ruminantium]|uniref:UV DNA damage repair endonuclease UvsE n=1 Tax=Brevibacillus ruminantium TaxID=2950604 RepID=A0ABY4WEN6_9BACL|nr:UV DNA damage repair endonuclease UvsE [Brevibacillus ruminantium]USG63784.1 UV DNA damage repair endonuclease UvsE [Brevibacillus ruminantium]
MIRLGYACIRLDSPNNPNKKTTVAQLQKLAPDARLKKLRQVLQTNFFNLMDLLAYNVEQHIFLYRLPSEFIPLATHRVTADWDWAKEFAWDFDKAGAYIRKYGIRVTSHPGHYSILNTDNPSVLQSTIADFSYHARVFDLMGLDDNSVLVTHVGGLYNDKESSLHRFAEQFALLPDAVKRRLVVENDDTSFSMIDVLTLCESIGIPMVLDVHHHNCLNNGEDIFDYMPRILKTWGSRTPKMHFSSPKCDTDFRAHADKIDPVHFMEWASRLSDYTIDVMLECKNKDDALLTLRREMQKAGFSPEGLFK